MFTIFQGKIPRIMQIVETRLWTEIKLQCKEKRKTKSLKYWGSMMI